MCCTNITIYHRSREHGAKTNLKALLVFYATKVNSLQQRSKGSSFIATKIRFAGIKGKEIHFGMYAILCIFLCKQAALIPC